MKNFFAGILKYHFLPIIAATALAFFSLYAYQAFKPNELVEKQTIKGEQTVFAGVFGNCIEPESEVAFVASLSDKETITIFGSSEFGRMEYSPYYFLPDSLNMPLVGFGHAHHQHFSMFCELLAMKDHLKDAKVCIVISPSWFETEGTNIEAFLEFVRPNFLKSIIHDDEIPLSYKMEIGKFVSEHFRDIENPSEYLFYFRNLYENRNIPMLNEVIKTSRKGIKDVQYEIKKNHFEKKPVKEIDWKKSAERLQKKFLDSNQNNSIFVNNFYFTEHLLKDGVYEKGKTDDIPKPSESREYQDFLLLIEMLKRYNCDATFIIQPLNPYHYTGLEKYSEVMTGMKKTLEANQFSYLDLFVTDPKKYDPATLNDIMHLGDYGWLKINRFLYENYSGK